MLFPVSVLDLVPGAGKAIAKAGKLIKNGHRAQDAAKIATAATKAEQTKGVVQKTVVKAESGQSRNWEKMLNNPAPDTSYMVNGRYIYDTDGLGRVEKSEGRTDA